MTPPGANRASLYSSYFLNKMKESRKRKMVKTDQMQDPMAKRRRCDEILQKICSSIVGARRPGGSSTFQRSHFRRRKALPEPASVHHLLTAPPRVSSSYQMKILKKRKMAEIARMKEPMTKRHRHRQDEIQQQKFQSSVLTDDMILEIMMRLPARSVGRFRCVSNSWLSIAATPSFIKAHVERSRIARQTLVIADSISYMKPDSKTRLYNANLNAGIHLRELATLEMLNQSSLLASCDGLVLFRCIPTSRYRIINPLTGQFHILPQTPCRFNSCLGFYFHPPTSEYRLLANLDFEISYVNTIGKNKWRRIHSQRPALSRNFNPVNVGRRLYWLAWKEPQNEDDEFLYKAPPNTVMTFDAEAETYSLLPLPPSEELKGRGGNMLDFNGELGLWLISDNGIIDFWIMKECCWTKRCSVYHPNLEMYRPKTFSHIQSEAWQAGSAVCIKGEELLIGAFRPLEQQFLVHWNLKTGACLVKDIEDYSPDLLIQFPHIEALTLPPGHSFI